MDWVPRPTAQFNVSAGLVAKNDSIIRPAVCEGTEDHAEIKLTGWFSTLAIVYLVLTSSAHRSPTLPNLLCVSLRERQAIRYVYLE